MTQPYHCKQFWVELHEEARLPHLGLAPTRTAHLEAASSDVRALELGECTRVASKYKDLGDFDRRHVAITTWPGRQFVHEIVARIRVDQLMSERISDGMQGQR